MHIYGSCSPVVHLYRILLEVEDVGEEGVPFVLHDLVLAPSAPVNNGSAPEHALLYLLIHPGTAFTASHVMPPFDAISIILAEKNTNG